MKRFVALFAAMLVTGAVIGLAARAWRPAPAGPQPQPERLITDLALEITRAGLEPETISIPKDRLVRLAVTNHHGRPVTLSLAGYDERVHTGPIGVDSTWRGTFVADRPGEGFSWLVDGAPVGRLEVTGAHLTEGHR